jgi:hypothetical protein
MEILGASTFKNLLRKASFVIREASFSQSAHEGYTINQGRVAGVLPSPR